MSAAFDDSDDLRFDDFDDDFRLACLLLFTEK
jgi:hypothetical protein